MLSEHFRELRLIQAEAASVGDQVLLSERVLVVQDVSCELPKMTLRRRCHGGLVSEWRLWVKGQGEIAKLNMNSRRVFLNHLIQHRHGWATDWTLQVGKEFESHRGISRSIAQQPIGNLGHDLRPPLFGADELGQLSKRL
jgi:hypothetical protein